MIRRTAACIAVFLAMISQQSATAADPIYNWSGFYAGVNAGYGWGSANNNLTISDGPTALNCHFCSMIVGGNDAGVAQSAGSTSFSPSGFVGGAQVGYNWQRASWVYGVEGDFQYLGLRQTVDSSVQLPANTAAVGNCTGTACIANFNNTVKADWLLTIRPRVGYIWDSNLIYATAGLAISRLSFTQAYSDNVFATLGSGGSESASASTTRVGWTAGAGVERAIGANWSAKLEYLYVRFDGLNANGVLQDAISGDFANFSNNIDHLAMNIVRFGLNYKFSSGY
jgi:outer membrane immunogenic protein